MTPPPLPELQPQTRIGPYEIVRVLGHGGAGTVYLVRQEKPIARLAALKLLRLEMRVPEVVARFELEHRLLAAMDHPNIARVLDVGRSDRTGTYIVMEYVEGVELRKYCDERTLPVADRLELFLTVCRAIQHAHGRGVLHRDLKPSNVLVGEQDGRPRPVVIDFGVARWIDRAGGADLTRQGQPLGTPHYMSPEQLELSPEQIDARTDVYSLGVLLFELVVGVLPHERKYSPYHPQTLVESVRREESTRPSTKFGRLAAEAAEIARARRTTRDTLLALIRGDLDWILLKALEKDRERRYATVSELAADVERYVERRPIVARPPSSAYRFERFVARNRLAFAACAALLAATVAGAGASALWFARAARSWRERSEVVELCHAVRSEAANAHLWLEETLADDPQKDLERDVREPIRRSIERLSEARLAEARVASPEAVANLRGMRDGLERLDRLAVERWEQRSGEGRTGMELDQRFDEEYERVQTLSADTAGALQDGALAEWRRTAGIGVAANAIGLLALACVIAFAARAWRRRV